ncbi:MAG: glucosamine-6-phosphate deaminase [Acidimicrobiaceae bacterium]|nr:glucosamine-6-phosphate deaminase [Acidimicrobiaceae bacterium]
MPVIARRVDRLDVEVYGDVATMARAAADHAARAIRAAVEVRGVAHAMFATGNSQLEFIEALTTATPDVPWSETIVFHMDEYVGIGPDHPAGFQRWIRERIVERAHPRTAFYVDGLGDPDQSCRDYARLLRTHPLDLCCLGIGENGHLAFNDPPVADFDDPLDVKEVSLDQASRTQQVNEGHFEDLARVPTRAITVTVPALLRARSVMAVAPEHRKAEPVRASLEGPVWPACPASALRTKDSATLFLDPGSASLLGWR